MYKDLEKKRIHQKEWYHANIERERERARIRQSKYNKIHHSEILKKRKENPQVWESYNLKSRYGITLQDKLEMIRLQDNRCASCGEEFSNYYDAHLDHDHVTDKVRGILCKRCNLALGFAREDIGVLQGLINYINKCK